MGVSSCASSFSNLGVNSSGPHALFGFRFRSSFSTPFSVIVISGISLKTSFARSLFLITLRRSDVIHGYPVFCLIVHLGMYLLTWSFTEVLSSFHIVSMSLLFFFFSMNVSEKAFTSLLMES